MPLFVMFTRVWVSPPMTAVSPSATPERFASTAAFHAPANGGAPALAIKQAWWRQVLGPDLTRSFPRLRMVNWFEWRKYEPEVHAVVDWTVTRDPAQRTGFRAHLPDWLRYANAVDFCRR